MTPARFAKRRGVSEVVGALLLIVVVVGAVGSLAVFVGSAQKQAQNRQSYLTNVQNDNLQIVYAQFLQNATVPPTMWASINLTIRNTNTQASALSAIELNGYFAHSWVQVDQSGHILEYLGLTQPALPIPAKGTVTVALNASSYSSAFPFARDAALTVVLRSAIGNFFTTTYSPPTAIAKSGTSTENDGPVNKDTVTFDASQSYGSGASIQSYSWELDVPISTCGTSSFSSSADYYSETITGEQVQYNPSYFFSQSPPSTCITGPIQATLTVTDQNGFIGVSQPLLIAQDPNIDPVSSITASKTEVACPPLNSTCTETVTVRVNDIFGNPVSEAVVNAIPVYGNTTPVPLSELTDGGGIATFTVSWPNPGSGDVSFETGNLLPSQVAFP